MPGIGSAALGTQQLEASDIQIGVVEIKDATSDTGATVDANGLHVSIQALTASDIDIRDLTSADVVTVTGGAGQTADVKVTLDSESVAVTGTFWQATQPVSATDLDIRNLTATDVVTANLSVTDNAVLDDIALNQTDASQKTQLVDGTGNVITATSNALDINIKSGNPTTMPVTNAGTFAVQVDGDALTTLQLIDDVVFTDDTSTHSTGNTKGVGIMAAATPTDGSVTANDIGMLAMSVDRRLHTDAQIVGQDANLTVDLGATDNTVLDNIDTDLTTIIGHVDGIETVLGTIDADTGNMATSLGNIDDAVDGNYLNVNCNIAGTDVVGGAGVVAAGVQRMTLASDDPAVTALQIIDDWDSGDTCKVTLQTGSAAIGKLAANSGVDIGDVDVTSITNGSLNGPAAPVVDSYAHIAINLAAGANQVLVSSSASHQIWVYGVGFVVNAAGTVSFQDEDDTAITGIMPFAANSGLGIPPSGNFAMPIWKLATDKDLEVDIVTSEVDGWLDYAIVNA